MFWKMIAWTDKAYQFWELCQAFGDFGNISQLDEILGLKHIHDSVSSDLSDDSLDPVQGRMNAPVVVNGVQGHGVKDDAGHDLAEDWAVLDESVVVCGWLLVDNADDPLQHLPLQLQIFLKKRRIIRQW